MNSKKYNSKDELVSVIMVNWNGKKWLKKCLETLQEQSYKNTEVIIIDNASDDDSVEYLKDNFPKVKIIVNRRNLGYPRAVNIGIKNSKGEYLLLINNDTWVEKDFIKKLLYFFKKNDFTVISPIERRYDKTSNFISNTTIDPTGSPAFFSGEKGKTKHFFLSVCYLISKKDYMETLGFDNDYFAYYEDVDWFWRMNLLGKKFAYADNVFVYHAGAGSTGKGIKYKMFLYRNQNALQTLIKNYSLITLILILPLYLIQNIFEILFFLIIFKPKIAYSYIEGWYFNLKNLHKIIKKRKWIQKKRKVSDWEIIKKMYWGLAKFKMLLNYQK